MSINSFFNTVSVSRYSRNFNSCAHYFIHEIWIFKTSWNHEHFFSATLGRILFF
jgi:hypothetical protein